MDYQHLEYHRQRARELVDRAEQERAGKNQRNSRRLNLFRRRNESNTD
ncbi:MAG: hypothetical protein ACPG7F_03430 [Aggregatilineales bacterium]